MEQSSIPVSSVAAQHQQQYFNQAYQQDQSDGPPKYEDQQSYANNVNAQYQTPTCPPPPAYYDNQPPAYYTPPDSRRPNYVGYSSTPYVFYQPVAIRPSYASYIVVSCLVFWFCGWLFGGIAFILAIMAKSQSSAGDHRSAGQLAYASCAVSIFGVLVGVAVWTWLIWFLIYHNTCSSGQYRCGSSCYNNRVPYYFCFYSDACYSDEYCYFNYK